MSKAYKCDRCGTFYLAVKQKPVDRYGLYDFTKPADDIQIHLCDGCYAMLKTFISGEPFGCVVDGVDMDDLEAVKAKVERYKEECRELKEKLGMIRQLAKEHDHL